jgi:hypothetical protein
MHTPDDNRASWQQVFERIAEYPDTEYWNQWKRMILPILQRAMEQEFDSLFRAGMAMHLIIFSTLDHHGLRDEPRVNLQVMKDWNLRISSSKNNVEFNEPAKFAAVDQSAGFPTLVQYLQQLWEETMPGPIPDRLRS